MIKKTKKVIVEKKIQEQTEKLETDIQYLLEAQKIVTGDKGKVKKDISELKQVILSICKEKKEADEK